MIKAQQLLCKKKIFFSPKQKSKQIPIQFSNSSSKFKDIKSSFSYYKKLKETLLHNYKSNLTRFNSDYKNTNAKVHKFTNKLKRTKEKLISTTKKIDSQHYLLLLIEEEIKNNKKLKEKKEKVIASVKKLDLSRMSDGKAGVKNKEVRELREKLGTEFGDNAEKI